MNARIDRGMDEIAIILVGCNHLGLCKYKLNSI